MVYRIELGLFLMVMMLPACQKKVAEVVEKVPTDISTIKQEKLTFPDDWLGYWEGTLDIYNASGKVQSLPMALDNARTENDSIFTWAIIYGEDTIAGRRDYLLQVVDAEKGLYVTDEQNGILLDNHLVGNELISVFEVMGNTLTTTYRREGDEMFFEILMFKSKESSITGDTLINGEEIPAVKNFPVGVTQKARLRRRTM